MNRAPWICPRCSASNAPHVDRCACGPMTTPIWPPYVPLLPYTPAWPLTWPPDEVAPLITWIGTDDTTAVIS